ncbi:response regulator [Spirosoma fluviale]|uniref:Two component transcriptional regulator, LytTR family n=1 Tax=Spirosoma fluviale TaxID=1597977 RepID=A0A286GPE3_9BACT|nr:response regulator [Spirosoma fluviale]SOD97403.1 two component transcriptional regulator, LytTR family [Spirosoma fluviale]
MSIRILVIEDVAQIRENIAELLTISGYEVQTAADGVKGISLAQQCLPELILSDIMMPDMDGYQVLQRVRMNPNLAHTPFIFLTAKSDMLDLRYSMNLGADDYLTKPFRTSELLKAIESRLTRVQQQNGVPTSDHYLKTVNGRDRRGTMVLAVDECFCFFTKNREYFVNHPAGTFQVNISLDKLTAGLDPMLFFRANRNILLHRKTVQKYTYWDKGKYCLFLTIGQETYETTLAKARFRDFKNWLSG